MVDKKILLVMDDNRKTDDMKNTLESFGYDVSNVGSCEEALEKTLDRVPDLILIDEVLKGDNDFTEAVHKIKGNNIPIIYLTDDPDSKIERIKFTETNEYIINTPDLIELKYIIELSIYKNETEKKLKQSELKYKNIFENILDIFYQTDINGIITEISPSIERYLGYKPSELLGQPVENVYFNPDERKQIINKIIEDREIIDYEFRLKTKNNRMLYVSTNTHLLFDSDHNHVGFEGTIRDITERKKINDALEESEQRLTEIIEFLPDATFAIDQEGKVIAWNRAIEEMTGTKKDEIIGKGNYAYSVPWYNERRPILIDLIGNEDSKYISKYKYVRENGNTLFAEVFVPSVYHGQGAYLWVTASPLLNNKGEQYGAIESVRDITDRKKAEDALKISESLYRTIFENTGAATLIYDKNGIISMINSEMEHLSGFSKVEVEGRMNWMKFVHHEDLQMMIDHHKLREKNPNAAPSQYETRFINRKGK